MHGELGEISRCSCLSRIDPALGDQCADFNSQEIDTMSARILSLHSFDPRRSLPAAFAAAALAVIGCARADTATYSGDITVSLPTVETVGSDSLTGAPLEKSTVTARVAFDPPTLTTESGAAHLRERVLEAASEACRAALTEDDERCVREAIQTAQPQIDAAIARSRRSSPNR
jgi:UrcA family protein